MDNVTAAFVEGIGGAAATSGVLSQLQGRIFALLYVQAGPLSLEDIADELQQSKSNISVNIRGLVEWHMVRRVTVKRSRKDHYETATDFWLVMREIMERRFRWNIRQALAAVDETSRALESDRAATARKDFVAKRLAAMRTFLSAVDAGIGAFTQGHPVASNLMQNVVQMSPVHTRRRR